MHEAGRKSLDQPAPQTYQNSSWYELVLREDALE
jgi:hypothetical protein